MNRYNMYCAGGMGCFSTYNPLFVGWGRTRIGRGMYWENEYFVDPVDVMEIDGCKSNVLYHDGYVEVYPLYPDTVSSGSINSMIYGVVTVEENKKPEMEKAGFYHVHSNYGYSDFRVPSLELNAEQSKILIEGISNEVENGDERGKKDYFKFLKVRLDLVSSDNNITTILDCGKKLQEVKEEDLVDGHFEFTLSFADQELKLAYTNEQSKLLIECIK